MSDAPKDRDLVPPKTPADDLPLPAGLLLGVDAEELYLYFAESGWTVGVTTSRGNEVPAGYAHKIDRIRTDLWSLSEGSALVRQLDEALAQVPAIPSTSTREEKFQEAREAQEHLRPLFADFVTEVALRLPPEILPWYEVGVFLAQVHVCLDVLASPDAGTVEWINEEYVQELHRVASRFVISLHEAWDSTSSSSIPPVLDRSLRTLAQRLEEPHENSLDAYRVKLMCSNDVFTEMGMTHSSSNLAFLYSVARRKAETTEPEAETRDPQTEVQQRWDECHELLLAKEYEAAEHGLHALLVTARRSLGPRHHLPLMIQADLSMALMGLGRVPLCIDLALDAVDDAARLFGDRHPLTATLAQGALWKMVITDRPTREIDELFQARLKWLLNTDDAELSEDLRLVRHGVLMAAQDANNRRGAVRPEH
ncbi:hypothetical protein [Lentzea sp.]|uniref:hypothetical protein n=1 Tax=Lentzea sp. TaxID=56099 RepID=UPI002ED5CB7F